jgi:hypothetical protein
MRATLDWSHNLLSEEEKALFWRLSVFVGGFTLDAAEVVGANEETDAEDVLELLGSRWSWRNWARMGARCATACWSRCASTGSNG